MTDVSIDSFSRPYRFLSNFWLIPSGVILLDDPKMSYPSTEHAYQAAKTLDLEHRKKVLTLTSGQAKRFGRDVEMRPDWYKVKVEIMTTLLVQKFGPAYPDTRKLANMLDNTGDVEIIEGNTWGDTFWGVCRGKGENHLGKILMQVRSDNRERYG